MSAEGLGWASISELARLRGVDKAAISRRVARLAAQGLLTTRTGKQGTKLVNIAEFDRAAGEATDAVRELNGRGATAPPAPGLATDPILSREQARRAAYDADLKKLDLEERLGRIAPLDRVRRATAEFTQSLARVIDMLPARVEEILAAGAKDGVNGARAVAKMIARELREEMAKTMAAIADAAEGEGAALDETLPPALADSVGLELEEGSPPA